MDKIVKKISLHDHENRPYIGYIHGPNALSVILGPRSDFSSHCGKYATHVLYNSEESSFHVSFYATIHTEKLCRGVEQNISFRTLNPKRMNGGLFKCAFWSTLEQSQCSHSSVFTTFGSF